MGNQKFPSGAPLLLNEAKKITKKRILNEYAYCGHTACALLTKSGKIYTGICTNYNCALGNCAEYAAIVDMLKNNETEIKKASVLISPDVFFIESEESL